MLQPISLKLTKTLQTKSGRIYFCVCIMAMVIFCWCKLYGNIKNQQYSTEKKRIISKNQLSPDEEIRKGDNSAFYAREYLEHDSIDSAIKQFAIALVYYKFAGDTATDKYEQVCKELLPLVTEKNYSCYAKKITTEIETMSKNSKMPALTKTDIEILVDSSRGSK